MNSILVRDFWTSRKMSDEDRMNVMMELESPTAGPWGVRDAQLAWLEKDVASLPADTPVVVFTHSPLWDYYPRWNFQTEDAPQIRKILSKFDRVMAFHGHVHQVVYNKIGNLSSIGCLSTSWPWPYPDVAMPFPNIRLNRSAPSDFMDGLGSQFVNLEKDGGKLNYEMWADDLPDGIKNGVKL
jgi:3',5'-cyclic AMP phosphodiesterase CpdA